MDWSGFATHGVAGGAEGNAPACSYLRAVRSLMPARAAACFCVIPNRSFGHIQFDLTIVFHRTPPCLFLDGVMLGHSCSLVEENGLFVSAVVSIKRQTISLRRSLRRVHSGVDKAPPCSRQPGSPSPPPCHLHRTTRLRSHPSHFASTALPRSPPPQSIKMRRRTPTPPQLKVAISHKQNSRLTVSSLGRQG